MSHLVGKDNRVQSNARETLILEMVVSFLRTVGNEEMMAYSGTRSGGVYHTHLCISVTHSAPLAPQALAPCSVRSPGHFPPPAISAHPG